MAHKVIKPSYQFELLIQVTNSSYQFELLIRWRIELPIQGYLKLQIK